MGHSMRMEGPKTYKDNVGKFPLWQLGDSYASHGVYEQGVWWGAGEAAGNISVITVNSNTNVNTDANTVRIGN